MKKILFGILFSTIFVLVFSQEPEKTNSIQLGVGLSPLITGPKYGIVGKEIDIKLISGLTVDRVYYKLVGGGVDSLGNEIIVRINENLKITFNKKRNLHTIYFRSYTTPL